jgi:radical SAM superfamily enzyme YgiQ (UPF0313 family)
MRYVEPVFRPPSEAESYLLAVTTGCSHNRCSFCAMYRGKRFRARPEREVLEDIAMAKETLGDVRRVFLLDGDAFVLSAGKLIRILDALKAAFPSLNRVGSYVNAGNVLAKSDDELRSIAEAGLRIGYLGLESGDPDVVSRCDKGATVDGMVEAVTRAQAAGIRMSVMALLGLAGPGGSAAHARATALAANRMQPRFLSLLTVSPVPGTPLFDDVEAGRWRPPSPKEALRELRFIVQGLELSGTVFRSNHASNYLPLSGRLPADKSRLLGTIDLALAGEIALTPEFLRGL